MKRRSRFDKIGIMLVLAMVFADVACWYDILCARSVSAQNMPRADFLDVGQGDAELVLFPGNIKVMTDAGPDASVLASLDEALGGNDRYIDLAVITHPQSDHYNGYNYILDHYGVGAFIYNGRDDDPETKSWVALRAKIAAKNIPLITLGKGDVIHVDEDDRINIISPDINFDESGELNDTGIVEQVITPSLRILLTADTGFDVQDTLAAKGIDLHADLLKIAHHGSKYASSDAFLKAVDPRIAVIEVGAKNTYGHPNKETLARIAASTHATIFRTDKSGTIQIWREGGVLKVAKSK